MSTRIVASAIAIALLATIAPAVPAGDGAAAERQYRIARRLATESPSDALRAFEQVLKLDPEGPLADDALIEQALLVGLPRWPEQLGGLDAAACRKALALLDRVMTDFPQADRAAEARYYRALLRLEPLPTFDPSKSRVDLITAATEPQDSTWKRSARYAGAWFAANTGRSARAESAYGRLLVDAPASEVATRAAVGLAVLRLRSGEFAEATRLLDDAVRHEAAAELHAPALRELAVRLALTGDPALSQPRATTVVGSTGIKMLAALAATPDGLLVADSRTGSILQFARDGRSVATWTLPGVVALAVDGTGRMYAATAERIYRVQSGRSPTPLATVGEYGPPSSLAVEPTGRIWLLDRRGETIATVAPGRTAPVARWNSNGRRLSALTWDGTSLLAIDSKGRDVVRLDDQDGVRAAGVPGLQRPLDLAVDMAGRIAVLDGKDATIHLHAPGSDDWVLIPCKTAGIVRPAAIGFADDGALQVFDESSGGWIRLQ